MKVLLLQSSVYHPGFGENKANRLLLEAISKEGHICFAIARQADCIQSTSSDGSDPLDSPQIPTRQGSSPSGPYSLNNVRVIPLAYGTSLTANVHALLISIAPDWVFVSSEDFGYQLLKLAVEWRSDRVVYLARTTQLLPFGPRAFSKSMSGLRCIEKTRARVAVSKYLRDYMIEFAKLDADVVPLPSFGTDHIPLLGSFHEGYITMINPCAVKGISIFVRLAQRNPALKFAAVPTWGTTTDDIKTLSSLPNVEIWRRSEHIDNILIRAEDCSCSVVMGGRISKSCDRGYGTRNTCSG